MKVRHPRWITGKGMLYNRGMTMRNLLLLLACTLVCATLAAVSGCNRPSAQGAFQMPPPVVTTAPVARADVPYYLDEIGRTSAYEAVNIVPQVSGQIIHRWFEDGADIKAHQKLFEIEPRPYKAVIDQALAAVQQSQAQLANAKSNYDRVASELPSKAVSQQDYDNAKNAVDVAEANVKAAQAQVESAQWNLDNCTIASPIDGRAGQRLVDVGNVVTANMTNLLSIQRSAPIYIDFTVPEDQLDTVRQNLARGPLKVIVKSPNDPNTQTEGKLTFLDNAVQDGTGTIKLRATADNTQRVLWPGQFVNVRLILTTIQQAKLVPAESVQIGQQGPFVFIVDSKSTAEQRLVTPGQRQGDQVVILKGLDGNETVVRSGQMMLNAGVPVMVQSPNQQPQAPPGAGT
jgi:multidrug efflux system membrane fusion protein